MRQIYPLPKMLPACLPFTHVLPTLIIAHLVPKLMLSKCVQKAQKGKQKGKNEKVSFLFLFQRRGEMDRREIDCQPN